MAHSVPFEVGYEVALMLAQQDLGEEAGDAGDLHYAHHIELFL